MVDTNIVIDIMDGDPKFGRQSADRLRDALKDHALIIPPFVLCELLCGGKSTAQVEAFCRGSRIEMVDEVSLEVYGLAAERFSLYVSRRRTALGVVECPGCGHPNRPTCSECGHALASRKLPMDYLIGAFALCASDSHILTRDPGVYSHDLRELHLI